MLTVMNLLLGISSKNNRQENALRIQGVFLFNHHKKIDLTPCFWHNTNRRNQLQSTFQTELYWNFKMTIEKDVINFLRPNMKDFMTRDDSYWERYDNVLDACAMTQNPQSLISLINEIIRCEYASSPAHDAAVDIATTLENIKSDVYSKKFKYF